MVIKQKYAKKVKQMNHGFSIEIATEYGIEEAIILENIKFWLDKNIANKTNLHDNNYWTYNSQEAFAKLFPYMNRSKIQRVMANLEKNRLILKGNYNKAKYDKTTWYALTPLGYSLFNMNSRMLDMNNGQFNINNRTYQNGQPIPVITTDINSDITTDTYIEELPIKEIAEKIPYKEIITYLNEQANKNFKFTGSANKDLIKARFNDGFTLEEFTKVIDIKCEEWIGDTKMEKFLQPSTLFSNKFDNYLNQEIIIKGKKTNTWGNIDAT